MAITKPSIIGSREGIGLNTVTHDDQGSFRKDLRNLRRLVFVICDISFLTFS